MPKKSLLIALSFLLLSGCATTRVTLPPRSATEQLLISEAADVAALAIKLELPEGQKSFVDATNFDGVDFKYALSAIRQALAQQGVAFTDKRENADIIIEVRAAALSIDSKSTNFGIPTIDIRQLGIDTEGLKLFSRSTTTGVAKFSLFAYDYKTGKLIAVVGPVVGLSQRNVTSSNVVSWSYGAQRN